MVGQARRHGGRPRLPALGGARAVGGHRLRHGLTYARMREAQIVGAMGQNELLPQAILPLAAGGHPSPPRGDLLAERQGHALDEGGIALPTARR